MSRLAKKPIELPVGVIVTLDSGRSTFKGSKGENSVVIPSCIDVSMVENEGKNGVSVSFKKEMYSKEKKALLGTIASLIKSAIYGVVEGYEKKLELEGVGYKVQLEGNDLVLALGFTHPVRFSAPSGIKFVVEKNVITVSGINKEAVGSAAAIIRSYKPPEPYKGKGIHYEGKPIRRKAGKKAVGTA
jgi:large subunit ribosomal protein L6